MNPPPSPSSSIGDDIVELSAPPKPPLAFRVGIVGHRPHRLQQADLPTLSAKIHEILAAIREEVAEAGKNDGEWYAEDPPTLHAISPLAEGTDRIFAEAALKLGWKLTCVMPFPKEEFEKDFAGKQALEPNSLARFRALLDQSDPASRPTRIELDGSRQHEGLAYATCGSVVLDMSDLLIAVWDGDRTKDGQGGTAGTMDVARRAGIPVVWIDAVAPHRWRLIGAPNNDLAAVRRAVHHALSLPKSFKGQTSLIGRRKETPPDECLRAYYKERRPRCNYAMVWKSFRNIVGDSKFSLPSCKVVPFEKAVSEEWKQDTSTHAAAIVDWLRPFYAWPDKLADLYADRYRSAFILCYLLAAVAVGLALMPVGMGESALDPVWIFLELCCILAVLLLFFLARILRWHERWIDYRLAAELIRHLRSVSPICGKPPFPVLLAHQATHGRPETTWMNWHLRAVTRATGLGTAKIDHAYLLAHLHGLRDFLDGQMKFHELGERRSDTIERRLHGVIGISLGLTLLACILHLSHLLVPGRLLTFFCGFLPAVGAAVGAICNHGEFRRVAKRSHAMKDGIGAHIYRIDELVSRMEQPGADGGSFLPEVRSLSGAAADLLVREVLDWRALFLDRPPIVA